MATQNEHLDWAERNEKVADSLDRSDPVMACWAITAIFYAALHYVDAYLVSHLFVRPVNHVQREQRIRDCPDLEPIWSYYRRLKDMSREARYQLAHYAEPDYLKALKLLETVRTQVLAYRGR